MINIADFVNKKHWITKNLLEDIKDLLEDETQTEDCVAILLKNVIRNCLISLKPNIQNDNLKF